MTKLNIILILLILLFICNLVLFYLFISPQGKPHNHESPRTIISSALQFNEVQMKKYDELIHEHRTAIEQVEEQIARHKDTLLGLPKRYDTLNRDRLIERIGVLQMNIERIHWEHIQAIGALCEDKQEANWKALQPQLARIFSHPPPPHRP